MSNTQDNESGKHSEEVILTSDTHEQPPQEGSLRSLLRKASDFAKQGQRIQYLIDSYPKNRRYAHLKVNEMYQALVALYEGVFKTQWSHFKRVAEALTPHGTSPKDAQIELARIYISHWIVDLYGSNRYCVSKLTPVAFEEKFLAKLTTSSNEYDAFLVTLNSAIRPTHISGIHEDVMFIPVFPDNTNFNDRNNPFNIDNFKFDLPAFKSIILAIKDKRASWRTATLSTEVVGRPSWLFDWHTTEGAFSWFPMVGNYNSSDLAIAYILGVACTPNLAYADEDEWRFIRNDTSAEELDRMRHLRVTPRTCYGDYEINSLSTGREKFEVSEADSDLFKLNMSFYGDRASKRKRQRKNSRAEGDTSTPGRSTEQQREDDDIVFEYDARYACAKTYLYYYKVIFRLEEDERFNALLAILFEPGAHCTL